MIGKRPEVAALQRQVEEKPHHQRRAEAVFRWIDAALNEERRAHPKRDVERRNEAEIQPVGALERNPLTDTNVAPHDVRRLLPEPAGTSQTSSSRPFCDCAWPYS